MGRCLTLEENQVRDLRKKFGIAPVIKQIDTLGWRMACKNKLFVSYIWW